MTKSTKINKYVIRLSNMLVDIIPSLWRLAAAIIYTWFKFIPKRYNKVWGFKNLKSTIDFSVSIKI